MITSMNWMTFKKTKITRCLRARELYGLNMS